MYKGDKEKLGIWVILAFTDCSLFSEGRGPGRITNVFLNSVGIKVFFHLGERRRNRRECEGFLLALDQPEGNQTREDQMFDPSEESLFFSD